MSLRPNNFIVFWKEPLLLSVSERLTATVNGPVFFLFPGPKDRNVCGFFSCSLSSPDLLVPAACLFRQAEEQLRIVEEQRKIHEERMKLEQDRQRQQKEEQKIILGKGKSRPKLSFSLKATE